MPDEPLLLWDVTCIDGSGAPPRARAAILVERGRIARAGSIDEPWPEEYPRFEGRGYTVVPGLVDTHAHLQLSGEPCALDQITREPDAMLVERAFENARRALRAGITTICDCGARGAPLRQVQALARQGAPGLPRILAGLEVLTRERGHGDQFGCVAESAAELRARAGELIAAGADFIKVMASGGSGRNERFAPWEPQYSTAELAVLVETAEAHGRRVVAHARSTEAIASCVEAGVHVIAHCTWETDSGIAYQPDVVARMRERGTWVDPTLSVGYRAARSERTAAARRQQLLELLRVRYGNWARMAAAGVGLLGGSDAGTDLTAFDEPALPAELMVEHLGLMPLEAIHALTGRAARALGMDTEFGTIERGKSADLLLLRGDPLRDIRALRRVAGVMSKGTWVENAPKPITRNDQ